MPPPDDIAAQALAQPSPAHAGRPHLRALTGVRFWAALYVTVYHFADFRSYSWSPLRNFVSRGYVAVSLFFVLSGFILSYTYCGGPRPASIPKREFYASRLARIYPVYALGLALMGPFFVVAHVRTGQLGKMLVEALAVAGLVQSHFPSLAEAWNPPAWSLSTEAFFYLAFPLIVPLIVTRSRRGALAVGAFAWALSVAASVAYIVVSPDGIAAPTTATMAPYLNVLKYNPIVRLPEFVIGIVVGRLFLDREVRAKVAPHALWLSLSVPVLLVVGLAWADPVPYVLLHDGLMAPVFAVLILALAEGRGPVARWLSTPAMTRLGEASFSLYILHVPVGIFFHKAATVVVGPALSGGPAGKAVMVVVTILASLVCFRTVEVPMRARVRDALLGRSRRRTRAVDAPVTPA